MYPRQELLLPCNHKAVVSLMKKLNKMQDAHFAKPQPLWLHYHVVTLLCAILLVSLPMLRPKTKGKPKWKVRHRQWAKDNQAPCKTLQSVIRPHQECRDDTQC